MSEAKATVAQGYEQQISTLLGDVQSLPPGAAAQLLSNRSAPVAGAVLMRLDAAAAQHLPGEDHVGGRQRRSVVEGEPLLQSHPP